MTLSELSEALLTSSSFLPEKDSFTETLMPDNCNVTETNFFYLLLEVVSYLCNNVTDTKVNFTVIKLGYVNFGTFHRCKIIIWSEISSPSIRTQEKGFTVSPQSRSLD